MSEISKALAWMVDNSVRKPVQPRITNYLDVKENVRYQPMDCAYRCIYSATFEVDTWVDERALASDTGAALLYRQNKALREFSEAVFGEFRRPLYDAMSAVNASNYEEAMSILEKMHHSMFEDF